MAFDPIDIQVGANIRARRKALRLSQENLAATLGITFQQVQKYERGFNRVSASTLWRICAALDCPIAYPFTGLAGGDAAPVEIAGRMAALEAFALVPEIQAIPRLARSVRMALRVLLRGLESPGAELTDTL